MLHQRLQEPLLCEYKTCFLITELFGQRKKTFQWLSLSSNNQKAETDSFLVEYLIKLEHPNLASKASQLNL